MCLLAPFMKREASDLPIYESLALIDRSFEQILHEVERIEQLQSSRRQSLIKSVRLAVREARAWTLFEVLEIQHEREEREWTRLGRARSREEGRLARPVRRGAAK
jgi:hypothetical protein